MQNQNNPNDLAGLGLDAEMVNRMEKLLANPALDITIIPSEAEPGEITDCPPRINEEMHVKKCDITRCMCSCHRASAPLSQDVAFAKSVELFFNRITDKCVKRELLKRLLELATYVQGSIEGGGHRRPPNRRPADGDAVVPSLATYSRKSKTRGV